MQEKTSQLAIRFNTPQIFSRLLAYPGILKTLRRVAHRSPFLKLDRIPLPPDQLLGSSSEVYSPICAGVCGSDRSIVRLDKGFSTFFDLPDVAPEKKDSLLNVLQIVGKKTFQKSRILTSFTLGHEIVATNLKGDLGVLYPVMACESKFEKEEYCPNCLQGNENLCTRIHEGRVHGMAFGTGAMTEDGKEIGGGFQQKIIATSNQFFTVDPAWLQKVSKEEVLKTLVMTDSYACAVNSVDLIRNSILPDAPVLIVGFGAIGFCVLDYLHSLGFNNIFVLTRHSYQDEIVNQYGCHPISSNSTDLYEKIASSCGAKIEYIDNQIWFRGGFPVVFECVGSPKSVKLSQIVSKEKGVLVELGLPYEEDFDWNLVARKEVTLSFPYWASKAHFSKALENLYNISSLCKDIVQLTSVQSTKAALQAFFPSNRTSIKTAVRIDALE